MIKINFIVNDNPVNVEVDDNMRLIDVLREKLGLTGTKEGCGVGECGACTIILDGTAVCSCLVMACQLEGTKVETIENLEKNNLLSKLQDAFVNNGAIQCGFCTPGMLMSAKALIDKIPNPTDEQIREAIEGNLCRCTGYFPIIEAVKNVSS